MKVRISSLGESQQIQGVVLDKRQVAQLKECPRQVAAGTQPWKAGFRKRWWSAGMGWRGQGRTLGLQQVKRIGWSRVRAKFSPQPVFIQLLR